MNEILTAALMNQVGGDINVSAPGIVTNKGDLTPATAANTIARLAVGSNGQALVADSTQTAGMKWANAATAWASGKGDLLVASAANAAARLAVGSDGQFLVAASSQSQGAHWASIGGTTINVPAETSFLTNSLNLASAAAGNPAGEVLALCALRFDVSGGAPSGGVTITLNGVSVSFASGVSSFTGMVGGWASLSANATITLSASFSGPITITVPQTTILVQWIGT
ncbi:MAG: hypothetical protein KGL39_31630 [Patescibacteria group bacterium]|nr:hypothetical protein [Patescibacteria group bacterium]